MSSDELKKRNITETVDTIGNPIQTVYEGEDFIVSIAGDCVCITYRGFDVIDQMKIRELYYIQGDRITIDDILKTIKVQNSLNLSAEETN